MSPDLTIFLLNEINNTMDKHYQSRDPEVISGFYQIALDDSKYLLENTPENSPIYQTLQQMAQPNALLDSIARDCLKLIPATTEVSSDQIKFVLNQFMQVVNIRRKPNNLNYNFIMAYGNYALQNIVNMFENIPSDSSQFYQDMKVLHDGLQSNPWPTGFFPGMIVQRCLDEYDQAA